MERKLASIRKINDIVPIDGADMIELAIVGGFLFNKYFIIFVV